MANKMNNIKAINENINNETLIILDWDDTLFPTTWMLKNTSEISRNNFKKKYVQYLSNLDNVLSNVMLKLLKCGQVIIISNAMPEWLNISASMLPNTHTILKKYVDVISARDNYQKLYNDMGKWKEEAFKDAFIKRVNNKKIHNIISIGDAEYEYHALIKLYNYNNDNVRRYLKTIRFIHSPSYSTILDQLNELNKSIVDICKSQKHRDIKFNIVD